MSPKGRREREMCAYAKHMLLFVIREGFREPKAKWNFDSLGGRASLLPQVRGEGNRDAFEEDEAVWYAWSRWCRGLQTLGSNSESQLVFGSLAKL